MNLTQYFRLISSVIFQAPTGLDYRNTLFYCPPVFAKDGFNCSMQIHHGNYCESENGYREYGLTWQEVEFGFTNIHEPLMDEYSQTKGDTTTTVGRIPTSVMEDVFASHGGIDWETTLSVENVNKFLNRL